ncbi:MAG: hypothetical protein ABJV04_21300 [Aliiglaciecola sp.]|uniref:hypothetical protein n=1 Tax=Aliiglaciecola sp. TaxID=1872441 RepID=UPI0032987C35
MKSKNAGDKSPQLRACFKLEYVGIHSQITFYVDFAYTLAMIKVTLMKHDNLRTVSQ